MSKAINHLELQVADTAPGAQLRPLVDLGHLVSVLSALLIVLGFGIHVDSNASGCGSATFINSLRTGPCTNSATATFEVTNSGSISGGTEGVRNDSGGSFTTFTNAGSIDGSAYGVKNNSGSSIGVLTNTGTITGGTGISMQAPLQPLTIDRAPRRAL